MIRNFVFMVLSLILGSQALCESVLDFSLAEKLPSEKHPVIVSEMMPWSKWLHRSDSQDLSLPYKGPLFEKDKNGELREVLNAFESRGAAIVAKPITFFTKEYLLNIETIQKLDPYDAHSIEPYAGIFAVKTDIQFPKLWSNMLKLAQKTPILAEKTRGYKDYLELTSSFEFHSGEEIKTDPDLNAIVQDLDTLHGDNLVYPQVMTKQRITYVNEIAKSGIVINLYYPVGNSGKTLVVNYFGLTLKNHDLERSYDFGEYHIYLRALMLGTSEYNVQEPGLGLGLPGYTALLFQKMIEGFKEAK
jgi:hypothetical protein